MFKYLWITISLISALAGCAASPTERGFGDAVRHNVAEQRHVPAPAEEGEPATDAQRLESVMTVYRSLVGDPSRSVPVLQVEKGQGGSQ